MKICFLGAGSTVFAKNILGDCIRTPELGKFEIALHDINPQRLDDSCHVIRAINNKYGRPATVIPYLDRLQALAGADYIINAIQVGGYKPCTVTDFEIPKKYGLRQTIADTLGIGGIFRALRTIAVLEDFAKDIEKVCPDALFLNYTNPMAMLTGYLLTYTKVKAVGLCHSVQSCVPWLLRSLNMSDRLAGCTYTIGGINHQAWLLDIHDKNGNDLYPEIKARSLARGGNNRIAFIIPDMVRHYLMHNFGCYITESSEHSSEYLPYFIKNRRPDLIKKFNIPLDEYPRRCRRQIRYWKFRRFTLTFRKKLYHHKSHEYGSGILAGAFTGKGFRFNGSILNKGYMVPNLPEYACVEIPMTVSSEGFGAQPFQRLPDELAALNRTNINVQAMTIRAAHERSKELLYMAAALDPHTSSELTVEQIKNLCDDLYEAHRKDGFLPEYK
jgi:alpha-galactosidase